jgi:hypothetical protein
VKEIAPGIRWLQFDGCSLQRVGREAPSLDPLNYRCAGNCKRRHVDYLRVRYLTHGQVDRILKLITAGLAGPHVSNAMVRQVLRPVWCNHMPTTLRALTCCYFIHGRIPPLSLVIRPLKSRRQAKSQCVGTPLNDAAAHVDQKYRRSARLAPGGRGYQAFERPIM